MKSTNRTNHRRLASRKGGVWKNESLSESFGSRWENKVKLNAYYKKIKVFFDLACMSTCCWGLPKPKYEPFITHNRGTLKIKEGFHYNASEEPFLVPQRTFQWTVLKRTCMKKILKSKEPSQTSEQWRGSMDVKGSSRNHIEAKRRTFIFKCADGMFPQTCLYCTMCFPLDPKWQQEAAVNSISLFTLGYNYLSFTDSQSFEGGQYWNIIV